MDLIELVKSILRGWKIFFPIAALSAFAALQFGLSVEVDYAVEGNTIFVGPSVVRLPMVEAPSDTEAGLDDETAGSVPGAGGGDEETSEFDDNDQTGTLEGFEATNPFLAFSNSLFTTANATARIVDGAEFRGELVELGYAGDFELSPNPDGPIITVLATAPTAEEADELARHVLDRLSRQVVDLQGTVDIPDYAMITATTLTVTDPAILTGYRNRVMIGTFVLGIAVASVAAVFFDSSSRRRSAKVVAWSAPVSGATSRQSEESTDLLLASSDNDAIASDGLRDSAVSMRPR